MSSPVSRFASVATWGTATSTRNGQHDREEDDHVKPKTQTRRGCQTCRNRAKRAANRRNPIVTTHQHPRPSAPGRHIDLRRRFFDRVVGVMDALWQTVAADREPVLELVERIYPGVDLPPKGLGLLVPKAAFSRCRLRFDAANESCKLLPPGDIVSRGSPSENPPGGSHVGCAPRSGSPVGSSSLR
jgi:hypothetical protein